MIEDITGLGNNFTNIFKLEPIQSRQYPFNYMPNINVNKVNNWLIDIEVLSSGRTIVELDYLIYSKNDLDYLVNFFIEMQGSNKLFWFPTWSNEFNIISLSGLSSILIEDINFRDRYTGNERIMIKFSNLYFIIRQITDVSLDQNGERLQLDTSLPANLPPINFITNCSLVLLGRFRSSQLELNYESFYFPKINEKLLCRTKLEIIETPSEYINV